MTGKTFRLPTEAEWEFAARGGNKSNGYKYSGSATVANVAWYSANSENKTHEVATMYPNELGLCDMSGNVWEWTSSNWTADYKPETAPVESYFVLRGGSWFSGTSGCSVYVRVYRAPTSTDSNLGFRLAMSK